MGRGEITHFRSAVLWITASRMGKHLFLSLSLKACSGKNDKSAIVCPCKTHVTLYLDCADLSSVTEAFRLQKSYFTKTSYKIQNSYKKWTKIFFFY